MIRPGNTTRKKSRHGTKVLVVLLFIGGIALALKPSIEWIKGQLLHMEKTAHQNSLEDKNKRKWCADVFESDSISQADHAYCTDIWED